MSIPELTELPGRFGHFDLALLPTNGLCIRPMNAVPERPTEIIPVRAR